MMSKSVRSISILAIGLALMLSHPAQSALFGSQAQLQIFDLALTRVDNGEVFVDGEFSNVNTNGSVSVADGALEATDSASAVGLDGIVDIAPICVSMAGDCDIIATSSDFTRFVLGSESGASSALHAESIVGFTGLTAYVGDDILTPQASTVGNVLASNGAVDNTGLFETTFTPNVDVQIMITGRFVTYLSTFVDSGFDVGAANAAVQALYIIRDSSGTELERFTAVRDSRVAFAAPGFTTFTSESDEVLASAPFSLSANESYTFQATYNVQVDANATSRVAFDIPAPGTLGLMAMGLVGFGFRRLLV